MPSSPVAPEEVPAMPGARSRGCAPGDGRRNGESESFDAVVFHTTLCHVPGPELVLAEAFRVLRPEGSFAAFDDGRRA